MCLAARFGVPVARAAEMVSGPDFAEWMAAEQSGILDDGDWRRTARLCATMGQTVGAKVSEEQFMPRCGPPPQQTEAHMKGIVSAIFGPPQPAKKEA